MKYSNKFKIILLFCATSLSLIAQPLEKVSLKKECYETVALLSKSLLDLQIKEKTDPNFGALTCPECNVLHTRAAEAVFPFAVVYQQTGDKKYRDAAIYVTNWLIKQQFPEGQWKETPWEWTGTTADQLLMIVNAYPILKKSLSRDDQAQWMKSMKGAADYLVKYMSPDFASINYCPTSAAVLAATFQLIPDSAYMVKAKKLARWTVAKMDGAGFIQGEAARAHGVKYGVDLGYEMDMSLWGLGLYARISKDIFVEEMVKKSLQKNLFFIYPNGAIDASWGSRCYKWTTFGSKTADGPQILFSMFANEDLRYVTAAVKNLRYLRTMIKDGMIGNGPQFWTLFPSQLCNYPTFARAKNLSLAFMLGIQTETSMPLLPSEEIGWMKFYPTVNVALARSKNFMMTISGYGYKDLANTNNGQYNQHPTGGSVCNIWAMDHGFLQTSSQTKYIRGEPIHMPAVNDTVICLTPRIEFSDSGKFFTNLYEFEGRVTARSNADTVAIVTTVGEMKDERWYQGGVAYTLTHLLFDDAIEKTVILNFHDRQPVVKIIEPIVEEPGTTFEYVNAKKVIIRGSKQTYAVEILRGDFSIGRAEKASRFLFPFPSMKCEPLEIRVTAPADGYEQTITYRISVVK
ncbi:MAG: hypothetical protein Q8L88_06965 [Bacteroidota bacterium]|nr:hypothetical protein [Bacteroidota bacterium]